MDTVNLQFTQVDRDMLRDTNRDCKQILEALHGEAGLNARIEVLVDRVESLEKWRVWIAGIATASGFVIGMYARYLWH